MRRARRRARGRRDLPRRSHDQGDGRDDGLRRRRRAGARAGDGARSRSPRRAARSTRRSWTCCSARRTCSSRRSRRRWRGRDGEVVAADLVAALRALTALRRDAIDARVRRLRRIPHRRRSSGAAGTARAHSPRAGHAAPRRSRVPHRPGARQRSARSSPRAADRRAPGRRTSTTSSRVRLRDVDPPARSSASRARAGDVVEVQVGERAHRRVPADAARTAAISTPAHDGGASRCRHAGARRARRRPAPRRQAARIVRIDVRRLDTLMNLIGELVIARGRLTQLAGRARRLVARGNGDAVVAARSPSCATRSRRAAWCRCRRCSTAFRASCATRRARVGKQVEFVVEGKDIELDRSMLDEIGDSIVHLLRNAIDHGIETPEVARRGRKAGRRAGSC